MPANPTASPRPSVDAPPQRSRLFLLVVGVVVALSVVIAGVVIFSSGESAPPPEDPQVQVEAGDDSLVVGEAGAPAKVVVYEDFGSPKSREFETASRDFLRIVAADGKARVEYRPVSLPGRGYSAAALAAWGGVLENDRAERALAFHDVLFDKQPTAGEAEPREFIALAKQSGVSSSAVLDAVGAPGEALVDSAKQAADAAGVRTTPRVLVDGKPLTASSPTALADELQRALLESSAAS